jgi:hypothetical protein
VLFIGFFEYNADDADKVIAKFTQIMAERQTETEKFGKLVFGPYHFAGEDKGFGVYETDDPDRLMSLSVFYTPLLKWKFIPLIESGKAVELWVKMRLLPRSTPP